MLVPFLIYGIAFLILYFVIRLAVRSGVKAATAEQNRQSAILNRLLAEQLKAQGVSSDKVEEILNN